MRTPLQILLCLLLASSVFVGQSNGQAPAKALFELETSPMAQSNNTFAFNLYQRVREKDDNLIFSPFSITQALGMLYAGARGATQQQIAETLALPAEGEIDFAALSDRMRAPPAYEAVLFQLNIANSLWAQEGYALYPDYLDLLAEVFDSQLQEVDFAASDQTAQVINEWVSEQTQDKIDDLVNPASLGPLTRLILINAIYMNAGWALVFNESQTQDDSFTLLDGNQVTVPMMHRLDQFSYVATESFQAAELAYQQPNFSMIILLPDQGRFGTVEAMLSVEFFEALRTQLFSPYNLELALPRFQYDTSLNLAETLIDMGMSAAFKGEADFSGIAADPLFVDEVTHKAFISVDEKGTEAAAATEIGLGGGGPPNEPIVFNVDRPFIYIIYEQSSGAILFIGRVLDPSQ